MSNSDWTADPFDVDHGCGEHNRTTVKTFAGDKLANAYHNALTHRPRGEEVDYRDSTI